MHRRRRFAITAAIACGTLMLARPARAYRPFTGTDADVAGVNEIEIEVGPAGWQRAGGRDAVVAPSLIANWGFASDLELVVEGRQLFPIDRAAGDPRVELLDTQLDVKWVMRQGSLQNKPGPSIASEWTVLLPETGEHRVGAEIAALASMRWPALTLHVNGAAAATRAHSAALFASLIMEGPIAWPVRPVGEVFVDHDSVGVTELSGLAGGIWPIRASFTIDAGLRLSRTREAGAATHTTELRAGLTWAFSII